MDSSGINYIGTINDEQISSTGINVYHNPLAEEGDFLIGYKGSDLPENTPSMVLCPYQIITVPEETPREGPYLEPKHYPIPFDKKSLNFILGHSRDLEEYKKALIKYKQLHESQGTL